MVFTRRSHQKSNETINTFSNDKANEFEELEEPSCWRDNIELTDKARNNSSKAVKVCVRIRDTSKCDDDTAKDISESSLFKDTNEVLAQGKVAAPKKSVTPCDVREQIQTEENGVSDKFGSHEQGKDHFGWLMRTGRIITVDPLDTIPLACVRDVSNSGVAKLEYAFIRSPNGPGMSLGVSSAAPQPVVTQIPKDNLHMVFDYFLKVKGLQMDCTRAISTSKTWYGIIEGAHRRKALINLGDRIPDRFKGYPWVVICVAWQPFETIRAFARERNELQRGEHLVDFTLYDTFKNLKQSADTISLREGLTNGKGANRGYLKRVAGHYCGGVDTANNLTRQLAGIAVALSWRVIEEMGALLNREDPEAAKKLAMNSELNPDCLDARVCRTMLTKSTFRGATTFKTVATELDQINTLRRLPFLAQEREYKPISKADLEWQTKKAIDARLEVEKRQKKIGGHSWPTDMKTVMEELLTTTSMDDDVEKNQGSNELLPIFQKLWERLFPITAELETAIEPHAEVSEASSHCDTAENVSKAIISLENSTNETDSFGQIQSFSEADETSGKGNSGNFRHAESEESNEGNDQIQAGNIEGHTNVESMISDVQAVSESSLEKLSVRAINNSWEQFQKELLSEDLFEFIFADPLQSLSPYELKKNQCTQFKDERKIKEFANFCRVTLRPGCYVFVIVRAEEFSAFRANFQAI